MWLDVAQMSGIIPFMLLVYISCDSFIKSMHLVNKYNNFDYSIEQDSADANIKSHVRKCLEGFPVLVFLNLLDSEGTDQCYYLGIYNFNLGRGSHFNLGYSDLRLLDDVQDATNSFTFTLVDSTSVNNNIAVAEIQNNRKY
jgi:hypothetical protein